MYCTMLNKANNMSLFDLSLSWLISRQLEGHKETELLDDHATSHGAQITTRLFDTRTVHTIMHTQCLDIHVRVQVLYIYLV